MYAMLLLTALNSPSQTVIVVTPTRPTGLWVSESWEYGWPGPFYKQEVVWVCGDPDTIAKIDAQLGLTASNQAGPLNRIMSPQRASQLPATTLKGQSYLQKLSDLRQAWKP